MKLGSILITTLLMFLLSGCGMFWGKVQDIEVKENAKVDLNVSSLKIEKTNKDTYDTQVSSKIIIPQFVINTNVNDYKSFPMCETEKYKDVFHSYMGTTKTYITEIETITDTKIGTSETKSKTTPLKDGYEILIKQCIEKNGLKTVFDINLYSIDTSNNLIAIQSVNNISTSFNMNLEKMAKCSGIQFNKNILSTIKFINGVDIVGNEISLKDGINIDFYTCLTDNRNVLGDLMLESFTPSKIKK